MSDSDARLAMSMLDSIDYETLPEADRHRYDLLQIKISDHTYVRLSSDSLILDVVEYYGSHRQSALYPQALYYAGRVYSNLGDLPTALGYFQKAIDQLPDKEIGLKASALSQIGHILGDLRNFSEAVRYARKAYDMCATQKDSIGMFHAAMDVTLLYINMDSIEAARNFLSKAEDMSPGMADTDRAFMQMNHAQILMLEDKTDSALAAVRSALKLTDFVTRNYALAVATDIYRTAGLLDTAFIYSRELVKSPNFNNRITGFDNLFSHELYSMIPKDSIAFYVQAYNSHMDEYLDKFDSQATLIQNSQYNYSIKTRERNQAIEEKLDAEKKLNTILALTALLIILFLIITFYVVRSRLKAEIKLRMAIQVAQRLQYISLHILQANGGRIEPSRPPQIPLIDHSASNSPAPDKPKEETLRHELREIIRQINEGSNSEAVENLSLCRSALVSQLEERIAMEKGLLPDDPLWKEIEEEIHKASPGFRSDLTALSLGKMDEREYRVAMLVKCGFKPTQISVLLLKNKSAATDRRRSLALKILGSKDTKALDRLIRLI